MRKNVRWGVETVAADKEWKTWMNEFGTAAYWSQRISTCYSSSSLLVKCRLCIWLNELIWHVVNMVPQCDISTTANRTVTFKCPLSSAPNTVSWMKDGHKIESDTSFTVHHENGSLHLAKIGELPLWICRFYHVFLSYNAMQVWMLWSYSDPLSLSDVCILAKPKYLLPIF